MSSSAVSQIHLSYPELIVTCNSIQTFMLRDTIEFALYGITTALITAFKTKITEFSDLPTDVEIAAVVSEATATKTSIANDLRIMLRSFTQRARLCFGEDSPKYSLFHTSNLSKISDSDLLTFGRMVKRSSDLYHTELLVYGLTAAMITALDTENDDFEAAINDQLTQIANRDVATNNRSEKALELYDLLVSYCEIGKNIWYETNPAYYNDYVIFGAGGEPVTLIAPVNFLFTNSSHKFTWDEISNATSYEIEQSLDGTEWINIYSGADAFSSFVPPIGISYFYRARARNSSGYGPYCDSITVTYVTPLLPPINLKLTADYSASPNYYLDITWETVSGATYYLLYESNVVVGQPAGTYTMIGEFTTPLFRKPVIHDRRYYLYVIAANASVQSDPSAVSVIDIAV